MAEINSALLDSLPANINEGRRNNTIFSYGVKLKREHQSPSMISNLMLQANKTRCNPPMEDDEINHIIKNVLNWESNKPLGTERKGNPPQQVSADLSTAEQAALQLEALFAADDLIAFNTRFQKSPEGKWLPNGKPISRVAFKVIDELHKAESLEEVFPEYNSQAGILFCVNPTKNGQRKNADIAAFRNALIEYDDISKQEQIVRLLDSGLPILSMTDSGNKSVHAIIRVDASNAKDYKRKVAELHRALEAKYGSPCDSANKNPSRMTRLAGATRGNNVQSLLYTEVNADSCLETFLEKCPKEQATEKDEVLGFNEMGDLLINQQDACFVEGTPAIKVKGNYEYGQNAIYRAILNNRKDARGSYRKEVMDYLHLMAPNKRQADPRFIRFKNGVLDIDTGQLVDNPCDYLLLNEIPHNWNPKAKSELVDSTFCSIAQNNEAIVANLWEMFGLALYRGHDVARMILLQGSGANGKSTLLDMLRHMLGEDNCFSLSICDLGEKFQLVPAMGKLALIGDDISNDYVNGKACAVMKKFVTGDTVNDQYKGGATFQFKPYATLIYSCNEIPKFADGTYGFERRIHPIPLSARFTPLDKGFDPRLGEKLRDEICMEYAITKAVKALCQCRSSLSLTANSLSQKMAKDIINDNDSVRAFIDATSPNNTFFVGKTNTNVYSSYKAWCNSNGVEPLGKSSFSKKLCTHADLSTKSSNGVRVYVAQTH